MDSINAMPSYLSETVYEIVVNLRKTAQTISSFSCVTEDFLFDWVEVDNALGNISDCGNIVDYSSEWFLEKNKLLWSIMNSVGEKFSGSCLEKKINFNNLSHWFDDLNKAENIFTSFLTFGDNELILCLLILTSRIERVLGNVYATSGKEVPFLLKDLLASDVLKEKLGKTQLAFLQLLLGCVRGLNLRNIAWHGFFSPGELHMNVVATLFIAIISLGHQLKDLDFPKRPYIKYGCIQKHSEALKPFYSSVVIDENSFQAAVIECNQIPTAQRQYWMYSYNLFLKRSFGDSLIFVLPLIESLLRSIFCLANQCPKRMLTAESKVFYITMDDILMPKILTKENRIENFIGKKLLEMLLDLFAYQEGPRLRDRISHAEICTNDVSESLVKHTFGMALSVMLTISEGLEMKYEGLFLELMKIPQTYQPLYHPASLLKSALINSIKIVENWSNVPLPVDLDFSPEDEAFVSLLTALKKTAEYNFNSTSDILETTKNELVDTHPLTLFRPKYELELIALLRRITDNIAELDQNILLNCQKKYEFWMKKTMKSRVRDNYRRMISFLPLIQLTMTNLIFLMAKTLKCLHNQDENAVKGVQRLYKYCLQYVENGVSMSNTQKNRWSELRETSISLCNLITEKYPALFETKSDFKRMS